MHFFNLFIKIDAVPVVYIFVFEHSVFDFFLYLTVLELLYKCLYKFTLLYTVACDLYRQRSGPDDRADRFKQAVRYYYSGTLRGFIEEQPCK